MSGFASYIYSSKDYGWIDDGDISDDDDIGLLDFEDEEAPIGLILSASKNNVAPVTIGLCIRSSEECTIENRIYTGLLISKNSIMPCETLNGPVDDNEYIRLEGGDTSNNKSGGIRFGLGYFAYGISTSESNFHSDCAILLGESQKIVVGSGPEDDTYIRFSRASEYLNIQGINSIRINGLQVLHERISGWTAPAGTISRGGFNIDDPLLTAADVGSAVGALIADLTSHGLIGA